MLSHMLAPNHIGRGVIPQPSVLDDWIISQLNVLHAEPDCGTRGSNQDVYLGPVVQEFQQLIESDPEIFMYFHKMFDEVRRPADDVNQVSNIC